MCTTPVIAATALPGGAAPQAARPKASAAHRADIQGLRAVAVLLVVLAHAGVGFVPGGFVGVDVFFVLSGFLITGLLLEEARAHGSVSLLEFYVRRARRILPAAALTLVATDAAALFLLNFVHARAAVVDSLNAGAFAANFHFAAIGVDYFARQTPPSPILHYWSLSVEEQFYVAWPLLLSLALFGVARRRSRGAPGAQHERRRLLVVVVLAGSSLGWSISLTQAVPATAYFSPFTRAWELGLGAAIAVAASTIERTPPAARLIMGWAGIFAVVYSAVAFSDGTPFPGAFALVPTVGTALAIVAGMGSGAPRFSVGRVLSVRPMCIVGDRSYALYLWHWPVLIITAGYAGRDLGVGVKLGLMVAAFVLSCVSYALVENPIRHRLRSRTATVLLVAVFTAALLGTASASLAAIGREQHRFERRAAGAAPAMTAASYRFARTHGALPAVVAAVRAARRGAPIPAPLTPRIGQLRNFPPPYRPPDGCILRDSSTQTTGKVCRLGRASSSRLIVLIGDSHANMWLPPILEMAWKDGWAVVPLVRLGCTPGTWVTNERGCRDWYRWAIGQAGRLHASVTLLGGSIDERPGPATRRVVDAFLGAARELRAAGRVVVIGDPEGLSRDPVDCLLARHATMASCTTTWPSSSLAAYDEIARRAKQLGVGFLPTRQFVCFEDECPAAIGHTIAWMDTNHLTVRYATQIAGPFRAALLDVLAAG
jgi:peptidoglycan/LPS O-acetylase OafA/YrhL